MKEKKQKTPKSGADLMRGDIAEYLSTLKFQRKIFGGLDSVNVWKRIRKLDEMYSQVMDNQRLKYEALLEERDRQLEAMQKKFKQTETSAAYGEKSE